MGERTYEYATSVIETRHVNFKSQSKANVVLYPGDLVCKEYKISRDK